MATDFFDRLAGLDRIQQLQQTAQSQVGDDPALSHRLGDYQHRYWWMDPGAIWSMAKAGIDADHPDAQTAAKVAAGVATDQGVGFDKIGGPVRPPANPLDVTDVFSQLDAKQQQKTPQDISAYAPPPPSPIQQLFGKRSYVKGLGLQRTSWDNLPAPVRQELSGLTLEQADPSALPATAGTAQAAYKIGGLENASPDAVAALRRATLNSNLSVFGPAFGSHGPTTTTGAPTPGVQNADVNYLLAPNPIVTAGMNTPGGAGPVVAQGLPGVPNIGPAASKGAQIGFMTASAPLQEVQGQIRNLYELGVNQEMPNWTESQSDLGIAVGKLQRGEPVDIGSGIFGAAPDSPITQERQRRERERGVIAGHSVTLGRAAVSALDYATGHTILEPGSTQYQLLSGLVDAGVALKLDPTAKALGGFGTEAHLFTEAGSVNKAIQSFRETGEILPALKAFQEAGGVTGLRGTVSQDAVNTWLDGPQGQHVANQIANTSSGYLIWRKLNRQADPVLAATLAKTTDPNEVTSLLRDSLGSQIRHKPDVGAFTGMMPGRGLDEALIMPDSQTRWTAMMPGTRVNALSPMDNALQVERAGALLKMREAVPQWFDQMAAATSGSERQQVWGDIMNDAETKLLGNGIAKQRARQLTRLNQTDEAVDRVYSAKAVAEGTGRSTNQLVVGERPAIITENQPTMLSQTLNDNINMPNWRAMRVAMMDPKTRWAIDNPAVKGAEHLLMAGQTVWKGVQIATVKTMIKVLGDEQLAMAGRGFDSLANHPIHALGMIMATPLSELPEDAGFLSRLQHATSKDLRWTGEQVGRVFPSARPSLLTTQLGHDFTTLEDIQRVAAHGLDTTVTDPGIIYAKDWQAIHQGQQGITPERFLDAHARNLAQYAASPETREFARAPSLEAAQQWYWDGAGRNLREDFARRLGDESLAVDRAASDAHVAKTLDQMHVVTNGNPTLMGAIASGKLDGTAIWANRNDGSPAIARNFINKLGGYQEDFPLATIEQKALYSVDKARAEVNHNIFGRAIHTLLGTPSGVLSKSPLYRQAYWERAADNASFLTLEAQAVVRANAEAANLPKGLMGELETSLAKGSGRLTAEQSDQIAQGFALDLVRRTTHEFSQRSQLFDQLRLLSPFGEVWRKTILRWANIIRENPAVPRRLQQGVLEARSADAGELAGAPMTFDAQGRPVQQGFFHKDQFGQEVFSIPMSEMATHALTGVPVPLVGNVQGLTVGTEIFPAIGPAMSLPVSYLLSSMHASPTLQDALFPYGPPKDPADMWNYAPTWLKSALGQDRPTSPDSVRVFANQVKSVLAYGITNGDYDVSTSAGIQSAVEDATNKAHSLNRIQGAAQFFIPGAPSKQFLARDKDGKLVDLSLVIQKYQELQDPSKTTDGQPGDPNTASDRFVAKFGPDIFKAITSKSYTYVFGVPTTLDSAKWVDDHPDVRREYPLIYGYFAPPSDPKNFDYNTYVEQFNRGERVALTPEQWVKVSNSRLASMEFAHATARVDKVNDGKAPDANQRAWLAQVKQQLMDQYPGYKDALYGGSGLPSRPEAKELVRQATKASDDPTVTSTDAGQGLVAYLKSRDIADKAWQQADKSHSAGGWATASSPYAVSLRQWLRQVGTQVTDQHAQFGPLFDSVFEREMKNDTNPQDLTGANG